MAVSKYLGEAWLNAAFRNIAFSSPTTVYLALYTTDPTDYDTGTEVSTSGTAYTRRAVTFGAPTEVSGKNTIANASDIEFPVATADWGLITHVGVKTASSGGNLLYYGPLTNPKTIETGDQFKVAAGNLVLDIN